METLSPSDLFWITLVVTGVLAQLLERRRTRPAYAGQVPPRSPDPAHGAVRRAATPPLASSPKEPLQHV